MMSSTARVRVGGGGGAQHARLERAEAWGAPLTGPRSGDVHIPGPGAVVGEPRPGGTRPEAQERGGAGARPSTRSRRAARVRVGGGGGPQHARLERLGTRNVDPFVLRPKI